MTRQEHLEWCKKRALEYVDRGDAQGAFASMLGDLSKHPDFKGGAYPSLMMLGMMEVPNGPQAVGRWIKGFN